MPRVISSTALITVKLLGEPKNNSLLRKENTKGVILKQKETRMAEDGEDWSGLEMTRTISGWRRNETWSWRRAFYCPQFIVEGLCYV